MLPRCCMCKATPLMLLGSHDLPAHGCFGCLQESASGNLSVEAEGLGGKALEELKVIQGVCTASRCSTRFTLLTIAYTSLAHCLPAEDKSFRHPRTAKSKSAETNFKMPCGVIQMPEPMLKDTDTLTLQTEVSPRTCFKEVDAPVLLSATAGIRE